MHKAEMRQVQQVVDDQLVIAFDIEIRPLVSPIVVGLPGIRNDQVFVGQRRITHPDPDPVVFLDDWIGADLGPRRDRSLSRHMRALARRIELKAVIVAFQLVADEFALRQRHSAVAAAVFKGLRRTILLAPEDNVFIANGARHRCPVNFFRLGADVPGIL